MQELDAVGFVVEASRSRLTASQKYVFNSVMSIFGKDVEENIRFLVTFADGNSQLVLDAIKEANLPCQKDSNGSPRHQSFNNGAIYNSNAISNSMLHFQWKEGMKNFQSFFAQLDMMPTKSLNLTKEVLEKRKLLEIQLDFMLKNIDTKLMKVNELHKTEEIINLNKDQVDANKDFEIPVPVSQKKKVATSDGKESALNCVACETTCHYPCHPKLWTGFCPAFWGLEECFNSAFKTILTIAMATDGSGDNDGKARNDALVPSLINPILEAYDLVGDTVVNTVVNTIASLTHGKRTCKVCPGKCPSDVHANEDTKWEYVQEYEIATLYDIRKKYEEATGKVLDAEGLKNVLQTEIEQLQTDIVKTIQDINQISNVLREIALRGNPLSTPEYIQMLIENEKKDMKPGFGERIKSLEEVLKKANLTKDIIDGVEIAF